MMGLYDEKPASPRGEGKGGKGDTAPLLDDHLPSMNSTSYTPFNYSVRRYQDRIWGIVYIIFVLTMLCGGIYASQNRNRNFEDIVNGKLNMTDALSCPHTKPDQLNLRFTRTFADKPEFDASGAIRTGARWITISLLCSLGIGLIYVFLFMRHARAAIRASFATQVVIPVAMGLFLFAKGNAVGGFLFMMAGVVNAGLMFYMRNKLELCTRLLEVGASSLHQNHLLVPAVIGIKVLMLFIIIPLLLSMGVAYMNGTIINNPFVEHTDEKGFCYDEYDSAVPCCSWKMDEWVPVYVGFAAVALTWSFFVAFELRLFTVSSAISQWYFSPVGTHRQGKAISLGMNHAFGPSFGSLSMAAAIMTAIQMLRNAANRNRERSNRDGNLGAMILACLVAMVVDCIAAAFAFLTKFTTIMMAVTGNPFIRSARDCFDVLQRNSMNTFAVWWIPSMVVGITNFLITIVWTFTTFLLCKAAHPNESGLCATVTILTFIFTLFMLSFLGNLLLVCVDSCYLCYAMDVDMQSVSKSDVHVIFQEVQDLNYKTPTGQVVEQPNGQLAYGA